jgi:hypothetical protein
MYAFWLRFGFRTGNIGFLDTETTREGHHATVNALVQRFTVTNAISERLSDDEEWEMYEGSR